MRRRRSGRRISGNMEGIMGGMGGMGAMKGTRLMAHENSEQH
jgi:hypothetical protein